MDWLDHNSLVKVDNRLHPLSPIFRLTPMLTTKAGENPLQAEFYSHGALQKIQSVNSAGIVTANDELCVQFTEKEMAETISQFLAVDLAPLIEERNKLGGPSKWKLEVTANPVKVILRNKKEPDDWQVEYAQRDVLSLNQWQENIKEISYRPFDKRKTLYSGSSRGFQCRPRPEVMQHMLAEQNIAIVTTRQRTQATGGWGNVFVTASISEGTYISNKTGEINYLFPLWLNPSAGEKHRRPNIDRSLVQDFGKVFGLTYEDGIPRGEQKSFGPDFQRQKAEQLGLLDTPWDGRGDLQKTFGPRDLFDYIYAVLHSPGYRSRYAEFLKSDFPRIPAPATRAAFSALVALGRQLVALHLLCPEEAPILQTPNIRFAGSGDARVERGYPEYENGKVMINANRWFEDVPKETWGFHVGGYQVCEKWLKDRAGKGGKKPHPGRILTDEDILHYRRVVTALTETRRLMAEIDEVIEKHGGWPGAFQTDVQVDA